MKHSILLQEVAAAMIRVAETVSDGRIREGIKDAAIGIMVSESLDSVRIAENFVAVGRDTGNIRSINAEILIRELNSLRGLLSEASSLKVDQLEIGDIFKGDPVVSQTAKVATSTSVREMTNKDKKETAIDSDSSQSSADRDENGRRWSSLDPDRVYRYIVNSGEARLRDLEAKFPEVSGRTLRRLTDQLIRAGRIERVGNPGPASFYRLCHALVPPNGTPAGFATPSI